MHHDVDISVGVDAGGGSYCTAMSVRSIADKTSVHLGKVRFLTRPAVETCFNGRNIQSSEYSPPQSTAQGAV